MNNTQPRPVPHDFDAFCMTLSKDALSAHYRAGRCTVSRWLDTLTPEQATHRRERVAAITLAANKASGKARTMHRIRPMPDDFAVRVPTMTVSALEKHYHTSAIAVRRWLAELPPGVTCKTRPPAKPKRGTAGYYSPGGHQRAPFQSENNRSTAQLAALHLQRRFAPVCSATIVDPAAKGQWIVGRRTMPEADMLAFAERQGWRRDAWQELRA